MAKKMVLKNRLVVAVALLTLLLVTVSFVGCASKPINVKTLDSVDARLEDLAYEYLQILSGEELKNRTMSTDGELDAANYISGLMRALGYDSEYSSNDAKGLQEFKTSFKRFSGEELVDEKAYNVIFSRKATSEKSKGEIILACQYDNMYSEKADISGNLWQSDGSYESGVAVAIMFTLAEALIYMECEYDLTFAFFTGGCYEWKGAMNYVDNLDREALDKIALVLNFSMLGGGDNWYIYTGESKNTYGRYLYACGQGGPTSVPKDRNIGQFYLTEDTKFSYTHIGMLSNHYFFDLKGIPTANFLSLNWGINNNPLFTEMKGKDNVYRTKNDTLNNMLERKGEEKIKAQMFEIVKTTLTALHTSNQDTLKSSLDVAKSEMPNYAAQNSKSATMAKFILKVILIGGLIVASYVIRNSLNKNMEKYMQARKLVKEAQAKEEEEKQAPTVSGEAKGDAAQSQEEGKSDEKPDKGQNEDPFV